jgi:RHS repeat-associated protein
VPGGTPTAPGWSTTACPYCYDAADRLVDNGAPTTYCYDAADRLVSSTDTSVGTPAYDARGNTTTLGPQALAYDGADRHSATTTGSTTVTYDRDATDRIVARRVNGTVVAAYGFAGPGDSPFMVNASTGVLGVGVYSRFVALLGGASLHRGLTGGDVWSYPNIHGDTMATANSLGIPSATYLYDPFGTPLAGHPDTAPGNFDYGWLGQHQRPLEREAGIATIEMGARQYVPKLGRFLQVDAVEGGSSNDYDYVGGDPVNEFDLDGLCTSNERAANPNCIDTRQTHGSVDYTARRRTTSEFDPGAFLSFLREKGANWMNWTLHTGQGAVRHLRDAVRNRQLQYVVRCILRRGAC